jgi:hypothetical protein
VCRQELRTYPLLLDAAEPEPFEVRMSDQRVQELARAGATTTTSQGPLAGRVSGQYTRTCQDQLCPLRALGPNHSSQSRRSQSVILRGDRSNHGRTCVLCAKKLRGDGRFRRGFDE